jgi:hypothetical protein
MIVVLSSINAVFALADLLLATNLSGADIHRLAEGDPVARGFVLLWCALVITAVVLLLALRRRGWALMMVLVGLSLAANLATWWFHPGEARWVTMGIDVLTALYLNSAQVRRLFLQRHEVTRISLGGRVTE